MVSSMLPTRMTQTLKGGRRPPGAIAAQSAGTGATWLLGLFQAGDSFYPTGGYAHSFGLEGLVQDGCIRDRATLRNFLFAAVLPCLLRTDLPICAQAWRAFAKSDWDDIGELCFLSAAVKTTREARLASETI